MPPIKSSRGPCKIQSLVCNELGIPVLQNVLSKSIKYGKLNHTHSQHQHQALALRSGSHSSQAALLTLAVPLTSIKSVLWPKAPLELHQDSALCSNYFQFQYISIFHTIQYDLWHKYAPADFTHHGQSQVVGLRMARLLRP